jgi:hypothetical protein
VNVLWVQEEEENLDERKNNEDHHRQLKPADEAEFGLLRFGHFCCRAFVATLFGFGRRHGLLF